MVRRGARIRGLAAGFASWEGETGLFGMRMAFGSGCETGLNPDNVQIQDENNLF